MSKELTPIVVGLANDQDDEKILEIATKLCARFKCPLRLVHAYESKISHYQAVAEGTDLAQIIGHIKDDFLVSKKVRLDEVAASLKVEATAKVLSGSPSSNLIAEAVSCNAWLILVGARPGGHKFTIRGQSVPISLFSSSPIPVMVVNDNVSDKWDISERLHVISSDDLTRKECGPTRFSAELVDRYGTGGQLSIFHVNPLGEDVLNSAIESALAATYSQPTSSISGKAMHETLIQSIKKNLDQQVPEHLKDKISWESKVINGSPERELSEIIENQHPHVAVFGKHKAVHRQPFYFGKLPFATAFNLDTPFVVVPD